METILILFVLAGIGFGIHHQKKKEEARKQAEILERERQERRRVGECGDVVLFFHNHFGYIAKKVISKAELEGFIDSGATPDSLAVEILGRMEKLNGLQLGHQPVQGVEVPVKLVQEFRDRHIYIVGKSGSGKTNLIRNLIYQDLYEGSGIGVIAPEQEMISEEILPFIPEERLGDVIYVNPDDEDAPVSFNPLYLDEGEDLDLKVDETLTILRRAVADTPGSRMEEILRQALYALIERPNSTLLDMEMLLDRNDPNFRQQVLREIQDERTVRFFRDVYDQFPKDAHLPITNRLGRLLRPKPVRNILCQPYQSINFRRSMDEGRILLFNLSDGILGEAASQILGQLVVSKFQTAVMSRADISADQRRPFYLYIDEFQTFTGTVASSYERILSRARKYRLSLILAHQQTGQIPTHLLKEIFGNVSTMISFVVSRDDAVKVSRELISDYNGEIVNVTPEEILSLKVGECYVKIGRNSFFMRTTKAPRAEDYTMARRVIESSRRIYGSKKFLESKKEDGADKQKPDLGDIDPSKIF